MTTTTTRLEVLFVFSLSCYFACTHIYTHRFCGMSSSSSVNWIRTKRAGYACLNNFCHFLCIASIAFSLLIFFRQFQFWLPSLEIPIDWNSTILKYHALLDMPFFHLLFNLTWQWLVLQSSSHQPVYNRQTCISVIRLLAVDEKCQVIRAKITKRTDRRTLWENVMLDKTQ